MSSAAIVAPRVACEGKPTCACCGRWRRCARIWLDTVDGVVVRKCLRLCSGCCKAAHGTAVSKGATP